jgi:hypothetical protein
MDRYPGGQFPYAAFFWPALAAASAGEIASSFAAHFLGSSADADGAAMVEAEAWAKDPANFDEVVKIFTPIVNFEEIRSACRISKMPFRKLYHRGCGRGPLSLAHSA